MDPVFTHWLDKGLATINDLCINNHYASFTQLKDKYQLPTSHFFQYLQIGNFVKKSVPKHHTFYHLLTCNPTSKGWISQFVYVFPSTTTSLHITEVWATDSGEEISDGLWSMALDRITACSINNRLQFIQFKVIHQL